MSGFDLKEYMEERRGKVETRLLDIITENKSGYDKLTEALAYSLFAGGKRLRPILAIAAHEVFAPLTSYALDAACALEMLHTYSLIHDDLPSFDNDTLRRGRPTCHVVYGEWLAILTGDALNTLAFQVLAGGADDVPAATKLEAINLTAAAAGIAGMVSGQALDMAYQGLEVPQSEVLEMEELKTGKMIAAAVEIGSLLGGAGAGERAGMARFGRQIGLAFQVRDDLLDIEGTTAVTGKSSGKDRSTGKSTLPALIGQEKARVFAEEFVEGAIRELEGFGEKGEPLRAIASYVVARPF